MLIQLVEPSCQCSFYQMGGIVRKHIDSLLAGGKGLAALRAADCEENAYFADGQLACVVVNDDMGNVRPVVTNFSGNLLKYLDSHGLVRLVFEGNNV